MRCKSQCRSIQPSLQIDSPKPMAGGASCRVRLWLDAHTDWAYGRDRDMGELAATLAPTNDAARPWNMPLSFPPGASHSCSHCRCCPHHSSRAALLGATTVLHLVGVPLTSAAKQISRLHHQQHDTFTLVGIDSASDPLLHDTMCGTCACCHLGNPNPCSIHIYSLSYHCHLPPPLLQRQINSSNGSRIRLCSTDGFLHSSARHGPEKSSLQTYRQCRW